MSRSSALRIPSTSVSVIRQPPCRQAILGVLLALGLLAIFTCPSGAQITGDTKAFSGTVTEVGEKSITVRTRSGDKTLAIDSATQFFDVTGINDLKVGQSVAVRTDPEFTKAIIIRTKWTPVGAVQPASTPAAPAE